MTNYPLDFCKFVIWPMLYWLFYLVSYRVCMRKLSIYTLASCLFICFSPPVHSENIGNGTLAKVLDSLLMKKNVVEIGPMYYELPPEKTAEQLLEEKYDEKHAGAKVLEQLFKRRQLITALQQTGQALPLPSHAVNAQFTFSDLENAFQRSLQAYLQLGNMEMVSNLQNRIGILHVENEAYDKALNSFQQALTNKEILKNIQGELAVCSNIASLYSFTGNPHEASVYFDRVRKLSKKTGNKASEVSALEQLALLKAEKGQYQDAEQDMIKDVIPTYKRLRNLKGRINAYNNLASMYLAEEKYTESRWFHLQAIKLAMLNNHLGDDLSYSLYQLGKIKKIQKEYDLAIVDYQAAASHAERSGDEWLRMRIYDDLGDIYLQTKDYANASTYLEAYEDLKEKLMRTYTKEENLQAHKTDPKLLVLM